MSTDTPTPDKVIRLIVGDLPNVPAMLRKLADDIESNEYGTVHGAAVVLDAAGYPMFGFGKTSGAEFHILCHIGMFKMARGMLKRNET